ncbi:glycoside hydrolase family 108 protein [Acidihalobacter prosperus]|uniref:Uncharacterized protein n=1 Tax=Acidihalobacter prosperus TaxID=160660 RepID=A0A1A6C8D1_9GAMM|nr:glycosyl hydrolase 108 family protein [Acidihalobacter prosperus]OBS10804.1 hypothetical protein Thpro_020520 [Acidihalobacter prosperus]
MDSVAASSPVASDPWVQTLIGNILTREGDTYTDRVSDLGGPTKYGITQATLAKYRGQPVTPADVEALTRDEAFAIYLKAYIDDPEFEHIDSDDLRDLLVDSGVQHGPGRAVQWVQRSVGVKVDGILGPISLNAINTANARALYVRTLSQRVRFYGAIITNTPDQAANASGWMNRIAPFIDREPFLTGAA